MLSESLRAMRKRLEQYFPPDSYVSVRCVPTFVASHLRETLITGKRRTIVSSATSRTTRVKTTCRTFFSPPTQKDLYEFEKLCREGL